MKILNGKKLSEKIIANLKNQIEKSKPKNALHSFPPFVALGYLKNASHSSPPFAALGYLKLRLAVVQVLERGVSRTKCEEETKSLRLGKNAVSQIFISQKERACQKTGIAFKLFKFSAEISDKELEKEIIRIVKNPINSGVVIQLPLPSKIFPEKFLNLIPEEKDTDVLSEKSLGKFYQGALKVLPPTVNGILYLLKNYKIKIKGKNVTVIGAGRLVGFPLAVQLLKEKATLSVLNEFTKDAPSFIKKADILISGVGKPNLIKGNMVKKGVIIIDAGCSMQKGKLVGDVDFKSVSKKAKYITPVPGGVGPMTVACLLENLVKLNK